MKLHKWMFRIVNTFSGLLAGILLMNTLLVLLFGNIENKKPEKVTVLYDSSVMNEFIVKETILPVLLEEKAKGRRVSVMPINDSNIEKSLLISEFLIVLSHGWNGAVYVNDPLTEYSLDKFRNANYEITVQNPAHVSKGIKEISIDEKKISGNLLPAFEDGQTHNVTVIMG